jgi:hypothetical protein
MLNMHKLDRYQTCLRMNEPMLLVKITYISKMLIVSKNELIENQSCDSMCSWYKI